MGFMGCGTSYFKDSTDNTSTPSQFIAQSAGAVKYTDWTSAEG